MNCENQGLRGGGAICVLRVIYRFFAFLKILLPVSASKITEVGMPCTSTLR